MKHFLKTIAMFCLGACTMASCGDEPTPTKQEEEAKLEVSKTELGFSQNADSKVVSVTTTGVWYVENNSDWISISPMGGKGNGAITVSVSQNASGQSRESYFSVAIDSDSKVVVVSQSATDTPAEENNGEETGGNDENGENGDNGNNGNETGDNNENDTDNSTLKPVLNAMKVENVTAHSAEFSDLLAITGSAWYKMSGDSRVGFCLSTTANPTLDKNSVYEKSIEEDGAFSDTYYGPLNPNTTYYVRSYAIVTLTDLNSNTSTKIIYGNEKSFKTLAVANESYSYATGAVQGYFSVSASSKVAFSQGNLQYQASTNTWRFAEHQYDMIGDANKNVSSTYSGWIDLFGWGTSGYNGRNAYSLSGNDDGADIAGTNYDWGVYNKISNGGNVAGQWRTLTLKEWEYVLNERADASSLKGLATVNGVKGMILLPDAWSTPAGVAFKAGMNGFENNTYTVNEWAKMEANGAIFLPAAGNRIGWDVYNEGDHGSYGDYWSSTVGDYYDDEAVFLFFYRYGARMYYYGRYYGLSVRLVRSL
ncbi:MAG: BACON domain-containing protein [Bacteroidales bacterium]|nr:BACON domain-containing protein [Bacteroidales bacterium]